MGSDQPMGNLDNMIDDIPHDRKMQIAEQVFAERFDEFITQQISHQAECFNGNTINLLLNRCLADAVDKLQYKYSDRLLEKIDRIWEDPVQMKVVDEGISRLLVAEASEVIDDHIDEVHSEIYSCMGMIIRQMISGRFSNILASSLTEVISDTAKRLLMELQNHD